MGTIPDFDPFTVPTGVHLTSYAGEARDLPADAPARYLTAVNDGAMHIVASETHNDLEHVSTAHRGFESHHRIGKRVVVLPSPGGASRSPMASWAKGCSAPPRVRLWRRDRGQGIHFVAGFDGHECFCSAWSGAR
jgi:hypothetical protein